MVLTFKDYTSLLEIRFDIENELNTKIDNIWFVYSKKSISAKTIKPICVIYETSTQSSAGSSTESSTESSTDPNQKHLSISELNELLGFIPCIATDVKKR